MPLTGQRKTDYQRVYMRERRAKAKAARNAPLPPVPALDWCSERLSVLPWQRDWLSGVLSDDVVYGAVSVARANGKSTWTGRIRAACVAPDGRFRYRSAYWSATTTSANTGISDGYRPWKCITETGTEPTTTKATLSLGADDTISPTISADLPRRKRSGAD